MTELPKAAERTPEAIAARLAAVSKIPIHLYGYEPGEWFTSGGSKYYGTEVLIGDSSAKFWHVAGIDDEPSALELAGWDSLQDWKDAYSDSHWQSKGDYDMGVFLINAQRDIQALLALLGTQIELDPEPSL